MSSTEIDGGDQQMQQLFAAVAPQVADRGFTDQAMRRIAWRVWIRRLASTAILVVAFPLLVTVLAALLLPTEALSLIRNGGLGSSGWDASMAVGFCLLLLLRVPEAVRG